VRVILRIRLDGFSAVRGKCLLTLLAYPLIYIFEKIFAITSDITLIELNNTNAPLLREMAFSAPGTFSIHYSGQPCRNAFIREEGTRCWSGRGFYHDIGKLENPLYFIENPIRL